ncbi:hypothetical protein F5Y19DRAFT_318158 [Xylariaceae sp. FL1651]|nr:hypothetical protein F5Y19DRAFT_318158 [Xylariaceae sp. FL1651]
MSEPTLIQSWEDRDYFVTFRDIPGDHVDDDRYYEDMAGGLTYKKHWCLLAEIIQADTIIRPRLVCRDAVGREFVVAFYPDNQDDMPRLLAGFKVGNTIAIFYALGHAFLDGSVGVRVEDADEVVIMPLNLHHALAMNKQAIESVNRDGTPRKCHGCGEVKDNLNKCGRCGLFHYCNRNCQEKGWNDKAHKKFCKVLKDENVKTMLSMDYTNYGGGGISFE